MTDVEETQPTPTCEECLAPLIDQERLAFELAGAIGLGPAAGTTDEQVIADI